jgi:hypothetical protein
MLNISSTAATTNNTDDDNNNELSLSTVSVDTLPASTTMQDLTNIIAKSIPNINANNIFFYQAGRPLRLQDYLMTQNFHHRRNSNLITTLTWTGEDKIQVAEAGILQVLQQGSGNRTSLEILLDDVKRINEGLVQSPSRHQNAMNATAGSSNCAIFMRDGQDTIAGVFKPRESEKQQRTGISAGAEAEREVAAFLLDHFYGGFCNVPPTILVDFEIPNCTSTKRRMTGSLQHYVTTAKDFGGDIGPSLLTKAQVHKLGLLDLRMINTDRNDSNLLIERDGSQVISVVPIDHGLCLPTTLQVGECDLVWLNWPQTLEPFDDDAKAWVAQIDANRDAEMLRTLLGIDEASILVYRVSMMLLQKGVAAGLNLREIASILVRTKDVNMPSGLENVVRRARELTRIMNHNSRFTPLSRSSSSSSPNSNNTNKRTSMTGNIAPVGISSTSKRPNSQVMKSKLSRQMHSAEAAVVVPSTPAGTNSVISTTTTTSASMGGNKKLINTPPTPPTKISHQQQHHHHQRAMTPKNKSTVSKQQQNRSIRRSTSFDISPTVSDAEEESKFDLYCLICKGKNSNDTSKCKCIGGNYSSSSSTATTMMMNGVMMTTNTTGNNDYIIMNDDHDVFFTYLGRLLDDAIDQVLEKRADCLKAALTMTPTRAGRSVSALSAMSATFKAFDDVASKLPSPRLMPMSISFVSSSSSSGYSSSTTITTSNSGLSREIKIPGLEI